MAAAPKVRYAPPDPTLPKPWKGLIDTTSGFLYFWNPETNTTTYEHPAAEAPPPPPPESSPPPPESSPPRRREEEEGGGDRGGSHGGWSHQGDTRDTSSQLTEASGNVKLEPSEVSISSPLSLSQQCAPVTKAQGEEYQWKPDVTNTQDQRAKSESSSQFPDGAGKVLHEPSGIPGSRLSAPVSKESGEEYRRKHEITIVGGNAPLPYTSFEAAGFPAEILKEIRRVGFSEPSPIQAQSWPIALENRDIVAVAKTGSGKTLGYLIPGFIHIKKIRNDPKNGPTILVLSPTRELATQIEVEAKKFGSSSGISSTCLYGGAPKGPQLKELSRGVDVVVATPGRLNDILEMRRLSLHQVSYLVLDEADRMLDMGFEPQIRKIVKEVPQRRQTLMFTATWPKEVRKIAADLLTNPVQVNVGNVDQLVANKAITQYVEIISPTEKQNRLEQILMSHEMGSRIIIFCSTKRMCDTLTRSLNRKGGAAAIHGDKSQEERDSVLNQFRTGRNPILVATDVAARGLDVKDIRVVINYDFPTGVEDYVHRIGRTARGGATGTAYTFFSDKDSKYASDLVKILEGANQLVPPKLLEMVSHGGYGGRSRRFSSDSGSHDGHRSGGGGGFNGSSYGGGAGNNYQGPSNDRSRSRSPPPW